MSEVQVLTAEEFIDKRPDLPDGGRFSELQEGQLRHFEPPDEDYSRSVMNLARSLSNYVHAHSSQAGYPCFDLGILLQRNPDTVQFPALCYFESGELFAEADNLITESAPHLIVEVISTVDRRQAIGSRIELYLQHGIRTVWTIDPQQKCVHVHGQRDGHREIEADQTLTGSKDVLSGFQMGVAELFRQPEWWTKPGR